MKLPEKGKEIRATLSDGTEYTLYRCNCSNPDCPEWRCPITGAMLMVDVVKWKYSKQ